MTRIQASCGAKSFSNAAPLRTCSVPSFGRGIDSIDQSPAGSISASPAAELARLSTSRTFAAFLLAVSRNPLGLHCLRGVRHRERWSSSRGWGRRANEWRSSRQVDLIRVPCAAASERGCTSACTREWLRSEWLILCIYTLLKSRTTASLHEGLLEGRKRRLAHLPRVLLVLAEIRNINNALGEV